MSRESSLPVVDRVEGVLKLPAPKAIDETGWHESAIPILFSDDGIDPAHFLQLGAAILEQLPVERLSTSLANESIDHGDIDDIRQVRKLLLIGRDTLVLSAADTSSSELDPMFDLSRLLGRVADTGGKKRSVIEAARAALNGLRTSALAELRQVPEDGLRDRCHKHLNSELLLGRTDDIEESVFHNARKNFRRVVHLAIVACAENPCQEIEELAAAGKEINVRYGSFHNKLLGKTSWSS